MTMLSNGVSGDAGAGPASAGAPNMLGNAQVASPEPEIEIDEDEMLEEEQKNKDAYTKMLIREELAEAQRATEVEIEILKGKVEDTTRYDNLEGRVEELEILFKKFHGKIDQEVVSLYAKMKIQQLMIQAVPKPKPADDPQFPEYDNLHKLVIGKKSFAGDLAEEAERYKKKWKKQASRIQSSGEDTEDGSKGRTK